MRCVATLLSTLPPELSSWLKLDLIHRVESTYEVPVHHVIGPRELVKV